MVGPGLTSMSPASTRSRDVTNLNLVKRGVRGEMAGLKKRAEGTKSRKWQMEDGGMGW